MPANDLYDVDVYMMCLRWCPSYEFNVGNPSPFKRWILLRRKLNAKDIVCSCNLRHCERDGL